MIKLRTKKAIIKKSCHAELVSVSKIFASRKSAMFALDARIALAIFGALSVITGAALYSAISAAKMESYRQYFVEHIKASEQYYLDNGTAIPQNTSMILYTPDLVLNRESLNTWKGPYVSYTGSSTTTVWDPVARGLDDTIVFQIWLAPGSTWSSTIADNECASVGNLDCYEYASFVGGECRRRGCFVKLI